LNKTKCILWLTWSNIIVISGGFVTALEYSAGIQAEVVGKPESTFFLSAVAELDVLPEQCVMIGDVSST
jgi:ribonucleotide monophosphatase NagD (HAD superfamily)